MFFQVVIVMVKDKKRCIIKDTMLIKTSFMHFRNYITWTRVKLPEVFEEFDMVYIFWLLFFFPLLLSVGKRSILIKIWGSAAPSPPGFYGPASSPLILILLLFKNSLEFLFLFELHSAFIWYAGVICKIDYKAKDNLDQWNYNFPLTSLTLRERKTQSVVLKVFFSWS